MPLSRPLAHALNGDAASSAGAPTTVGTTTTAAGLTRREMQVLALTAQGSTNRDIARDLGVTEHTVKFHLAAVYRKLSVTNRTEAAITYFRLGGHQA